MSKQIGPDCATLQMHDGFGMDVTVDDRGITLCRRVDQVITIPLPDVQPLIEYILFESPYRALLDLHHPFADQQDGDA